MKAESIIKVLYQYKKSVEKMKQAENSSRVSEQCDFEISAFNQAIEILERSNTES